MFAVTNERRHIGGHVWMFLRLDTTEGISGYGELIMQWFPWRPATVVEMVKNLVSDLLVGHEVSDVEQLYWVLYNLEYSHIADPTKSAITSALEMACFDILGKALGVPAYSLLGGLMRNRLRSYTYIYPGPEQEHLSLAEFWQRPADVAARALEYVEAGFSALKLDPVPGLMDDAMHAGQVVPVQLTLPALERAEELIATVRNAVGDRCDIIIGTHGQMTAAGAIRLARRLEKYDPLWFEEPVPPEMPEEMAKVARATTIPITAGERLTSKWDCARLINSHAVAVFNIDVGLVGGLLEAKKVAALAEANYVQISPHVYGGPFVAAASVQLGANLTNFLIMETNDTCSGIYRDLLDYPIEWREGNIVPSPRPGLGHNLNEEVARSLAPSGTYTRLRRPGQALWRRSDPDPGN